jgi:hypothetical protein
LERNARKAAEGFIHIQYLLGDRFGVADQQGDWEAEMRK